MSEMSDKFDEEIDRFDTFCVKWEFEFTAAGAFESDRAHSKHGDDRVLPLWVADMDFQSPPEVIEALEDRARHGIFGYCAPDDGYYEAVQGWFARHYGREIERDWILITPGVVCALNIMVQTFTEPGDKVIIQTPVYYPFYHVIENNGRVVSRNVLKRNGVNYEMDFKDLAQLAADPETTMAILCSPHNPVGRVWTKEELAQFGRICAENDVLVVSDEIHADLILDGCTFTPYASISEEFAENSIICTAPSKTFNVAGLKLSNIVIQNETMRERYARRLVQCGISGANVFGLEAAEAAYNYGEPWLEEVMAYIEGNYQFMKDYLAQHLPQLAMSPLEGTYLAWVDFSRVDLDPVERHELLLNEARVWLNEGSKFGDEGADFERFNIACPRSLLAEALERIRRVLS
jgi:cystathionine beta-lyase